jgi:hypothetical protein
MSTDNSVYTDGILRDLKEIIRFDVNAGSEKNPTEYMDSALENLKRRYQMVNKMSRYQAWTIGTRKEVSDIWIEIQPDILASIEKHLQEFKHRKLTKDIKVTTARAAIKAAMQEAGFKHHFVGQTHRAKVSVLITTNRALTTYISYKKLYDQLPHVIESIKAIRQELESLGSLVTINKVYDTYEWE